MSHDENDNKPIARRQFPKTAGVTAGATLGGAGLLPSEARVATRSVPRKWDEAVVVGTGFAGLTASIEARSAGPDVLVLEKMPVYGGNSIINGGDFSAAGNTLRKEAGIQDSSEQMLKDMLRAGANLNSCQISVTASGV